MADFSSFSDTDESAVEQILAEAMDHCVLQQVAAINCSSFSDSVLPSNLESRFQRLKTFPSSSNNPVKPQIAKNSAHQSEKPVSDNSIKTPEKKLNSEVKSHSGYFDSASGSSNSSSGYLNSPKNKAKQGDKKGKDGNFSSGYSNSPKFRAKQGDKKGKDGSFSSGYLNSPKFRAKKGDKKGKDGNFSSGSNSFSSNSSYTDTDTEKVKTGCLWCSPKRVSKKKKKKKSGTRNRDFELGDNGGKHDQLLSDLKSFSEKKQKNLMKIAKMEEEKINKEAEKIVKWAKQTSARLDFSVIHDDDLSDDDDLRFH